MNLSRCKGFIFSIQIFFFICIRLAIFSDAPFTVTNKTVLDRSFPPSPAVLTDLPRFRVPNFDCRPKTEVQ